MNKTTLPIWVLVLITVSNMIGGFFIVPSALAKLGAISLFGWIGAFIGALSLAAVFAILAKNAGENGGMLIQIELKLGRKVAFIATLSYWFTCLIGNTAFLSELIGGFTPWFPWFNSPSGTLLSTLILLWLLIALVIQGMKLALSIQALVSIAIFVIMLTVIVIGSGHFHADYLSHYANNDHKPIWLIISHGILICFWCFMGLETASVLSSIVRRPTFSIPVIVLSSVVISFLLCALASLILLASLPHEILVNSSAPFVTFFTHFNGSIVGIIVGAIINITMMVSLIGWLIVQSEPMCVAAQREIMPKWFLKRSAKAVPINSLMIGGAIMSIMLIIHGAGGIMVLFEILESYSVFNTLIPYFLSIISLMVILYQPRSPYILATRLFFSAVCITALTYIGFIVSGINVADVGYISGFVATGYGLAKITMKKTSC
ncbi:MAG: APC family permease [Francisellaceae bacterium]